MSSGPSSARRTAPALPRPVASTKTRRALSIVGGVRVSRFGGGLSPTTCTTRRVRSPSAGEPGNNDAVCAFADPEHEHVEIPRQLGLVRARSAVVVRILTAHAPHRFGRDTRGTEQGLARHAEIAVGVVRRHTSFVAEVNDDFRPVDDAGLSGERSVGFLRSRSTSQTQRRAATRRDARAGAPRRSSRRTALEVSRSPAVSVPRESA